MTSNDWAGIPPNSLINKKEHMLGATFTIKQNTKGEFYFTLKAANNEIIAVSEGYTTKQGCKIGIKSVKNNAFFAKIDDETK